MKTVKQHGKTTHATPAWQQLKEALDALEPFNSSALRGRGGPASGPGKLPYDWRRRYDDAAWTGRVRYVVVSYATPVAWYDTEEGWVVPDVRYSNTTSRHQSLVRRALAGNA